MKIILDKNLFNEKLSLATRFTSQRSTPSQILQGVLIKGDKNEINLYSSNLNCFFHTKIKKEIEKEISILVEPQKIMEFLSLLQQGNIEIEILEKKIVISQNKTIGSFPLLVPQDFPLPPKISGKEQKIKAKSLIEDLSQIIFSSARDEGRPVLTGVDFVVNEDLTLVTTDGFRLSLIKTKKQLEHPPLIIPAAFLEEVIRVVEKEDDVGFFYIEEEKTVVFKTAQNEFYSRLIEGDFPPFEKVIPEKKTTSTTLDKEDLLRSIKLISIFVKDQSNIVVFDFKKEKIIIRPKNEQKENTTEIETKIEGDEQAVAFNYRFLIDFLNHVPENKNEISIEVLRPDAPVVFRIVGKENYIHIIMPVRIQE